MEVGPHIARNLLPRHSPVSARDFLDLVLFLASRTVRCWIAAVKPPERHGLFFPEPSVLLLI